MLYTEKEKDLARLKGAVVDSIVRNTISRQEAKVVRPLDKTYPYVFVSFHYDKNSPKGRTSWDIDKVELVRR
jgi:hypothetical protein